MLVDAPDNCVVPDVLWFWFDLQHHGVRVGGQENHQRMVLVPHHLPRGVHLAAVLVVHIQTIKLQRFLHGEGWREEYGVVLETPYWSDHQKNMEQFAKC